MFRFPRPLGTTKFLLAWLLPWRPAFLIRAKTSRLRFFAYWRDGFGRHLSKYGTYEPELTAWIAQYLRACSPGIVVDVGANVGWHAIHAATCDAVETVVAFEPDAFNAWLLDRNLTVNNIDNVIVQPCAVGMQRGSIRLYRYKGSNIGRHSVQHDFGFGSRVVPMIDLDSALDDLGLADRRILLVKLDVEGHEPAVIAGATRTLARTDILVTEYSPTLSRRGGLSPANMLDRLLGEGFVPHRFVTGGNLAPAAMEDLRGAEGQIDLVWLRDDKHMSIQAAAAHAV